MRRNSPEWIAAKKQWEAMVTLLKANHNNLELTLAVDELGSQLGLIVSVG